MTAARHRIIASSAAFLLAGAGLTLSTASSAFAATTNTITVTAPSTEQSTVGTAASVPISATDSDSTATLTYSASSLPDGLSIDPSTGAISGTPTGLAQDTVTVTATDSTGATGTATIAWQVGGNITLDVPVGGFAGFMGQTVNMPFTVTDNAAGDTLSWESDLPTGFHVDPADSLIVGWPVLNDARWGSLTANGLDGGTSGPYTLGFTPSAAVAGATGPARLDMPGSKCLDDKGDSKSTSAVVDTWDCNGSAAQNWTYYSDGSVRINGLCLTLKGTTNFTPPIGLTSCSPGGDASQEWNSNTGAQLRSLVSDPAGHGYCLNSNVPGTSNGTPVIISYCMGSIGNTQAEWTLPVQTVHSAIAGRCLDDYQAKTVNGTPVDEYSCNGHATQNWTVEPDGTVRVNGVCLDDNGNSAVAGAKVQLWACNAGDAAEQWKVTSRGDNDFGLDLQHGSLCATPSSFTAANGAQLTLGTCGTDKSYWHAW